MELDLTIRRPALRYHGSKWRLAPWILSFLPEHVTYCEPFGGGAAVLLRKPRSKIEIYNDLDSEVVSFFRILRDPELRPRLLAGLELTPFSREEYYADFDVAQDPVERARQMVARAFMGFGSHSHNPANRTNGFRTHRTAALRIKSYAAEWLGIPENLMAVASRFDGVTLEHLDAAKCIAKYDHGGTCFYIDPPYVRGTRDDETKGYACEMSDADHGRLAWLLHQTKGRVLISAYDCDLYRRSYADWHREQTRAIANGQHGGTERTELLFMNFEPRTIPNSNNNPV
jgi:DNA adenine methylase